MSYLLEVCLVALTLSVSVMPSFAAQHSANAREAQELRVGISVELAVTRNAAPMPDADLPGASIVSVTRNGTIFLGIKAISSAALAESLKAGRLRKAGYRVFIKADTGAPYASVMKVLGAVRAAGDESTALLTRQRVTPKPGTPVPPYGLVVLAGVSSGNGLPVATVQLFGSGRQSPRLEINDKPIPWANLQSSMRQVLQSRKNRMVIVRAEGSLPHADIVHVIDACHSLGADVALAVRGL